MLVSPRCAWISRGWLDEGCQSLAMDSSTRVQVVPTEMTRPSMARVVLMRSAVSSLMW